MAKLHTTEAAVTATRDRHADLRRLRVHRRDAGRPLLPRRQDPRDRRGHQRGPAARDQPRAGPAGPMSRPRAGATARGRRVGARGGSGCSSPSTAALVVRAPASPPAGSPTCTRSTAELPRVAARLGAHRARRASDEPQNFLLVGVDSAANLAEDDPAAAGRGNVGGLRSDTMMILRRRPERRAGVAAVAAPRPLGAAGERRQPAHQQRHPERRPRAS